MSNENNIVPFVKDARRALRIEGSFLVGSMYDDATHTVTHNNMVHIDQIHMIITAYAKKDQNAPAHSVLEDGMFYEFGSRVYTGDKFIIMTYTAEEISRAYQNWTP